LHKNNMVTAEKQTIPEPEISAKYIESNQEKDSMVKHENNNAIMILSLLNELIDSVQTISQKSKEHKDDLTDSKRKTESSLNVRSSKRQKLEKFVQRSTKSMEKQTSLKKETLEDSSPDVTERLTIENINEKKPGKTYEETLKNKVSSSTKQKANKNCQGKKELEEEKVSLTADSSNECNLTKTEPNNKKKELQKSTISIGKPMKENKNTTLRFEKVKLSKIMSQRQWQK